VTEALLVTGVVLSALAVALCLVIIFRSNRAGPGTPIILDQRLLGIEGAIGKSDATIRDEFGRGREEGREAARSLREEVSGLFERFAGSLRASMNDLSTAQQAQLETFAAWLNEARISAAADARNLREEIQSTLQQLGETVANRIGELVTVQTEKLDAVTGQITSLTEGNERRQEVLRTNVEAKLGELKVDAGVSAKALREEITTNLQNLGSALAQTIEQISESQRERLDRVSSGVAELTQKSGEQQEALRKTVEERLDAIRKENTEKLDQMRQTVDEKLQSTLDQRLNASFPDGLRPTGASLPRHGRNANARQRCRRSEEAADKCKIEGYVGRGWTRQSVGRNHGTRSIWSECRNRAGQQPTRRICDPSAGRRRKLCLATHRCQVPGRGL
jgi:hypothetical protein